MNYLVDAMGRPVPDDQPSEMKPVLCRLEGGPLDGEVRNIARERLAELEVGFRYAGEWWYYEQDRTEQVSGGLRIHVLIEQGLRRRLAERARRKR